MKRWWRGAAECRADFSRDPDLARELGVVFEEGFLALQSCGIRLYDAVGIGRARDEGVIAGRGVFPVPGEELPGELRVGFVESGWLPGAAIHAHFDRFQRGAVVEYEA